MTETETESKSRSESRRGEIYHTCARFQAIWIAHPDMTFGQVADWCIGNDDKEIMDVSDSVVDTFLPIMTQQATKSTPIESRTAHFEIHQEAARGYVYEECDSEGRVYRRRSDGMIGTLYVQKRWCERQGLASPPKHITVTINIPK